jgi:hypothetical protein
MKVFDVELSINGIKILSFCAGDPTGDTMVK